MHFLSVGALFKNEAGCMKEWLEHYLARGVEHFYLIDDGSTDNFMDVLLPYMDRGLISLFRTETTQFYGRQRVIYNEILLPRLKESQWLLIVDLDEFLWSPQTTDFRTILRQCGHLGQIQFYSILFGSSGHLRQPAEGLVEGFTWRTSDYPSQTYKYFVNSAFEFQSLNVHHATFKDPEDEKKNFILLELAYFQMNHYSCQSREFWDTVKCTRGDSDGYIKRDDAMWDFMNRNDVEDFGLRDQKRKLKSISL
jgi:hypothetical protein